MLKDTVLHLDAQPIPPYTFDEFIELARRFHSYAAPGILVGGYMVAEAQRHIPEGTLYDALSETSWCLPDSIQMLTPCTVGNGWLRVLDLGVYAMSLFDKYTGQGVRVAIDTDKLQDWEDIYVWLFKTKPKKEQDSPGLRRAIGQAGTSILRAEKICLPKSFLTRRTKGTIARCPLCGDAYPERYGAICRRCQGEGPYDEPRKAVPETMREPDLDTIPVENSVGKKVLHDMTAIDPGVSKGPKFKRGHVVTVGDICRLQQMGRYNVHVEQECPEGFIHEDDAAKAFATAMAGPGTVQGGPPKEGKIQIVAAQAGLLTVREDIQEAFNTLGQVMVASRHSYTVMDKGKNLAATRAIPLFLDQGVFEKAMTILEHGPLFTVHPIKPAKVGLLITGNEIFHGLIEDKFESIITSKVVKYGCTVEQVIFSPDDKQAIADGVEQLYEQGCELLVTTAGMSVDPDDLTRKGLRQAGVGEMLHGLPVLPGAMTLLARKGEMRVIGVPACALFYKTTSLDLVLPRVLAGIETTRKDLAKMGSGGLCLECKTCVYPKCPFGK